MWGCRDEGAREPVCGRRFPARRGPAGLVIRPGDLFGGRCVGVRAAFEQSIDPMLEVLQDLAQLAGAAVGGIAQRGCGQYGSGELLELIAGRWVKAVPAHGPGDVPDT